MDLQPRDDIIMKYLTRNVVILVVFLVDPSITSLIYITLCENFPETV